MMYFYGKRLTKEAIVIILFLWDASGVVLRSRGRMAESLLRGAWRVTNTFRVILLVIVWSLASLRRRHCFPDPRFCFHD